MLRSCSKIAMALLPKYAWVKSLFVVITTYTFTHSNITRALNVSRPRVALIHSYWLVGHHGKCIETSWQVIKMLGKQVHILLNKTLCFYVLLFAMGPSLSFIYFSIIPISNLGPTIKQQINELGDIDLLFTSRVQCW